MKQKALSLIGLRSAGWLAFRLQMSVITLNKRLRENNFKDSEKLLLQQIFDEQFPA
jgi:hypothetical protein